MMDKLVNRSMRAHLSDIPKVFGMSFFFPMVHNVIMSNHTIFLKIVGGRTQREISKEQ